MVIGALPHMLSRSALAEYVGCKFHELPQSNHENIDNARRQMASDWWKWIDQGPGQSARWIRVNPGFDVLHREEVLTYRKSETNFFLAVLSSRTYLR